MNTKNSINESLEVIRRALEDERNDSNKHSSSNILTVSYTHLRAHETR